MLRVCVCCTARQVVVLLAQLPCMDSQRATEWANRKRALRLRLCALEPTPTPYSEFARRACASALMAFISIDWSGSAQNIWFQVVQRASSTVPLLEALEALCAQVEAERAPSLPPQQAVKFTAAEIEVERLRAAIRAHRDSYSTGRDDAALYACLPEGYTSK